MASGIDYAGHPAAEVPKQPKGPTVYDFLIQANELLDRCHHVADATLGNDSSPEPSGGPVGAVKAAAFALERLHALEGKLREIHDQVGIL